MAEWLKALVLKTSKVATPSRVRISVSPPYNDMIKFILIFALFFIYPLKLIAKEKITYSCNVLNFQDITILENQKRNNSKTDLEIINEKIIMDGSFELDIIFQNDLIIYAERDMYVEVEPYQLPWMTLTLHDNRNLMISSHDFDGDITKSRITVMFGDCAKGN